MSAPLYNRDILRLAASIPHVGTMADPDGRADLRSPVCGSHVVVAVTLGADGRIAALAQQVEACALGQASAALMGRHAIGRRPEELAAARDALAAFLAGDADGPGDWPGIDILAAARPYHARHASILLPFRAVADAAVAASLRAAA